MKNFFNNEIENDYSRKTSTFYRRSKGQFFTPFQVACFMSQWIINQNKKTLSILDPATGFGIFTRAMEKLVKDKKMDKELQHCLWEIDKNIAEQLNKLTKQMALTVNITTENFLDSSWENSYDGIIANPPYYKHHYIKNKEKIHQEMCLRAKHIFGVQTNIYCWFLIKSLGMLKEGGRLAFIIPSEFLNSNYGIKVKEYLLQSSTIKHLINIDFTESVFDNALTTSIILLAEKDKKKIKEIDFYNVTDANSLKDLEHFLNSHNKKTYSVDDLSPRTKWRNYFNGNIHKVKTDNLVPFSTYGRFSRGIATGANPYFTLSRKQAKKHNLQKSCLIPCITKANHVKQVVFSGEDFEKLKDEGDKKIYLFNGESCKDSFCKRYIKMGEELGIHKRYLTRNRNPWYALEKRNRANIWIYVFGRKGVRFVWNETNCLNLTCFHAFYPNQEGKKFIKIIFLYLNTLLSKKLIDLEKREYGNGLEKYEPNDINKSLVLNLRKLNKKQVSVLEKLQEEFISNSTSPGLLEKAEKIFQLIY